MRSGNALALFEEPTNAPVMEMSNDDPRMVAAIVEARKRWPEFVAAFQASGPEGFAVKATFSDNEVEESMWVKVQSITADQIIGELANAPMELKQIREGDSVTVAVAQVLDWGYGNGDQIEGLFTQKVLEKAAEES
jgi:uncharacterized protein YegJ (DUF2314 family)